jgi:molybdopterin converting factor small subunit
MKKYIGYTLVLAMVMASTTYADKGSETSRFKDLFGVKDRQEQRGSDDRDNETETEVEHGTTTQKVREEKRAQSGEKSVQTLDEARARAIKEIDQRIEAMNKLAARIAAMTRVSDAAKASIKATVDAQIASLTSLKTTIQSATDAIVLKEQAQTITKAYRIYMLVMPQLQIAAAADKIKATGELLTTMAGKLETRIAEVKAGGTDVAALETALADMKTQISEANANADAALALIANLKPDNGDQAVMDANKKALTDARTKIKAAHDDLKTARKDVQTIVKGLKDAGVKIKGDVKNDD